MHSTLVGSVATRVTEFYWTGRCGSGVKGFRICRAAQASGSGCKFWMGRTYRRGQDVICDVTARDLLSYPLHKASNMPHSSPGSLASDIEPAGHRYTSYSRLRACGCETALHCTGEAVGRDHPLDIQVAHRRIRMSLPRH